MFVPLACRRCDLDPDKWWKTDGYLEPLNILTDHYLFQTQSVPESAMCQVFHMFGSMYTVTQCCAFAEFMADTHILAGGISESPRSSLH